jgi:N-acetylglucosaminyldiphosphoundecaprenol N-acetyl-beta-D-mannosaminyltransferase
MNGRKRLRQNTGIGPAGPQETEHTAGRPFSPARVFFGATPVDAATLEEAAQWLLRQMLARQHGARTAPLLVMGPNASLVALAAKNHGFARALNGAALCLPDGMSVVWGAKLLGARIPERVPGGEFMERVCALCAQSGLTVYFLGGLPGAAEMAAAALTARYPGLQVAGTDCPPLGFETDEAENEAVRRRIIEARPDFLCVALGAPRQEIWMLDECTDLPIGAALSVGAALDTQAGLRRRAPVWTHNIGVEWLYRFAMEPRRLWRRYLIGNLEFAAVTLNAWNRRRRNSAMTHLLRPAAPEAHAGKAEVDDQTRLLLRTSEHQKQAAHDAKQNPKG